MLISIINKYKDSSDKKLLLLKMRKGIENPFCLLFKCLISIDIYSTIKINNYMILVTVATFVFAYYKVYLESNRYKYEEVNEDTKQL